MAFPSQPFYVNNYQYPSRPQHGYHQGPYSHQQYPQKFPQPYPHHPHHPPYPPYQPQPQSAASPNFAPHHLPWQPHALAHQPPLSPLPPLQQHHHVPRGVSPAYFDLRGEHPGLALDTAEPSIDAENPPSSSPSPPSQPQDHIPQHPIQPSEQEPTPQASTYTQTGTLSLTSPAISTSSFSSHPSPLSHNTLFIPSSSPPANTTTNLNRPPIKKAIWAVWSRRPQDPSLAPGIIISPSARPPPNVVKQALDIRTPPQSPALEPSHLESTPPVDDQGGGGGGPPPLTSPTPGASSTGETADTSTVPSSAASVMEGMTDLTDAPTLPGSPATSATSVSLSGTSTKQPIVDGTEALVDVATVEDNTSTTVTAADPSLDPAITTAPGPSTDATAADEASSTTPATTAPIKKSWASLLKPSSSTTPGPSGKNMLPTSNVVGISIPASSILSSSTTSSTTTPSAVGGNKTELVTLLTTGGPGTGNYASAAGGGGAQMTKLKPRGLVNSGNMCFANSVLQMLVYTFPFQRLFSEIGRLRGGNGESVGVGVTPLVDAMVEFVKEFVVDGEVGGDGSVVNGGNGNGWGKGKERERDGGGEDEVWGTESFLPSYVYEAMKEKKRFDNMRGGQQEDAEEFLGFLLETLEEELVLLKENLTGKPGTKPRPVEEKEEAAPPEERGWQEVGKKNRTVVTRTVKSTESPISKIFGGKFRTTLRVPHAKDSVIVEDWRSVRLDIQRDQIHTVQDALAYISQPQPVQVTNPARPGTTLEAHQLVHIDAFPPVLVLHMKRFCYDTSVGGVVKVGKQVTFGPELEIGNEVISPAIRKPQPPKYKLFGALYHHGSSASGGHYTLDVLHPARFLNHAGRPREGWIRIDDELASDVRPEDVFGGERDDNRSAYLLFYRRVR